MMPRYRFLIGVSVLLSSTVSLSQIGALPATFEVKSVAQVSIPFQNGMPVPSFEKQHRPTVDLGGVWHKQRFTANHDLSLGLRDSSGFAALLAEAAGRNLPGFDDSTWPTKALPAVENTMNGVNVRPEDYEDGVYYRRSFILPDSLLGQFARLNFYAVNYIADVWLNGHYLGYHEGGYTSFAFDATPALRFDSANVLVVRVDNPPWGSRDDIVPYGNQNHKPDWFNYTGIIHDVYLEFSNTVSIARTEVVPRSIDGSLQVTSVLWNRSGASFNGSITFEVYEALVDSTTIQSESPADLVGALAVSQSVGATATSDTASAIRSTLVIPTPKLWSPKHPSLYIMRAVLKNGAVAVDEQCVQFGIRVLSTHGNSVVLNGKPMFFPGIARHEDHAQYGRSVPPSVIYSDLEKVVDLNATFLRTAHYPNHPFTYLLADRLGIAVLEEIPVWWFDEADAWANQDLHRHIHEQMWREMVFRDRNRPSILFWSTCNECLDQTNRGAYIQRLNAELDTQYPDGRFVTESAAADRPGSGDPTQAFCDVAGWTMYFGVFYGSSNFAGTVQFLVNALSNYPDKPIIDTEFGYWSTENLSSAAAQETVFDNTFRAFSQFAAVDSNGIYRPGMPLAASTWWCIFDWCTIQQTTGAQTMGVYKMDHTTVKPVADHIRNAYRAFKASSETAVVEAIGTQAPVPTAFALEQNYPNPFNPTTNSCRGRSGRQWRFAVDEGNVRRGQVDREQYMKLVVNDVLSKRAVLANGQYPAGKYPFIFNATGLASGVYLYRLTANNFTATKAMLLIR